MKTFLLIVSMIVASEPAFAAQSQGNAALALAALIAEHSPTLSHADKAALAHLFAGDAFTPPKAAITIDAQQVRCRMGDVDITLHDCALTFGKSTINVSGPRGQLLLATMQENGVQSDGAAGTIYYSVAPIRCVVKPAEILSHDGGGARCTFTNGP